MDKNKFSSVIKCGKTFNVNLPANLDLSEPPIVLAEISVNTGLIKRPSVLLQYSEFIHFSLFGLHPKIFIVYRLVRENCKEKDEQILQEWEFELETPEETEVGNLITNQPTVLNFCDCLDDVEDKRFTYKLEITQIQTNNVRNLGITNKTFSGTLVSKDSRHNSPFVVCGDIFNPVLSLPLNKEGHPIKLGELTINTTKINNVRVLLAFSAFITSILREERFVDLVFRLVRKCDNHSTAKVLREWPFRRVFPEDLNVKEPVVYAYCDFLNGKYYEKCTYIFELVKMNLSEQSSFNITQKSMTAQVFEERR